MSVVKQYHVLISHQSGDPQAIDNAVLSSEEAPTIAEGIQIHLMDRLLLSGATVEVREKNVNGDAAGMSPFDFGDFIG
jgi:hypothetical protein